jgi:hypothetical protein
MENDTTYSLEAVAATAPYREPVGWLRCFRGIGRRSLPARGERRRIPRLSTGRLALWEDSAAPSRRDNLNPDTAVWPVYLR